mmetsp:Transcript_13642/g.45506  ORF Transcript_13642/g.45506 Transcript_13642/m.45506 type:complete len:252 (+) Transcript_13642:156-911(+)
MPSAARWCRAGRSSPPRARSPSRPVSRARRTLPSSGPSTRVRRRARAACTKTTARPTRTCVTTRRRVRSYSRWAAGRAPLSTSTSPSPSRQEGPPPCLGRARTRSGSRTRRRRRASSSTGRRSESRASAARPRGTTTATTWRWSSPCPPPAPPTPPGWSPRSSPTRQPASKGSKGCSPPPGAQRPRSTSAGWRRASTHPTSTRSARPSPTSQARPTCWRARLARPPLQPRWQRRGCGTRPRRRRSEISRQT